MTNLLVLGVLVAFAAAAASVGARVLLNSSWVQASPRWGIVSWQALTLTVVVSVILCAVTTAVPLLPVRSTLARWAQITPIQLDEHYATPGGPVIAAIALSVASAIVLRVAWLSGRALFVSARQRRSQLQMLRLVAAQHSDGYFLVQHTIPLVYCLPGRGRTVVVTSGAAAALTAEELALVLAHEHTHLRARHDLAIAVAGALAATFGPVPLFRTAHAEIAKLVEMQADDAARGVGDRRTLAQALLSLAVSAPAPSTAGADALVRVRRLTAGAGATLGVRRSVAVGLMTVAMLATPVALAMAPAIEAATRNCCGPDLGRRG